jgi:hypothetical protein
MYSGHLKTGLTIECPGEMLNNDSGQVIPTGGNRIELRWIRLHHWTRLGFDMTPGCCKVVIEYFKKPKCPQDCVIQKKTYNKQSGAKLMKSTINCMYIKKLLRTWPQDFVRYVICVIWIYIAKIHNWTFKYKTKCECVCIYEHISILLSVSQDAVVTMKNVI